MLIQSSVGFIIQKCGVSTVDLMQLILELSKNAFKSDSEDRKESCDTEVWKFQFAITWINVILKYNKTENSYFKW